MHVTMKRNEVLLIWSTVGESWTCGMEHCDSRRRKPHPHFPADSPSAALRYDDDWRREEIHKEWLVGWTGPAHLHGIWWFMTDSQASKGRGLAVVLSSGMQLGSRDEENPFSYSWVTERLRLVAVSARVEVVVVIGLERRFEATNLPLANGRADNSQPPASLESDHREAFWFVRCKFIECRKRGRFCLLYTSPSPRD